MTIMEPEIEVVPETATESPKVNHLWCECQMRPDQFNTAFCGYVTFGNLAVMTHGEKCPGCLVLEFADCKLCANTGVEL